jgi:small-conductance mechanosensitive channel
VLYRPISVGDTIQISSPKGLITAKVELISLGYTELIDSENHEFIVPNCVMMSSVIIRLGTTNDPPDSTN